MAKTVNQQRADGQGTALTVFRSSLLARHDDIARALAGTIDPQKFIEIALTAIATTQRDDVREKLLNCTPESLTLAVLKSAQTGLRLDGREAALVPYGRMAQFTPMVKGRINLIMRSPNVAKVVTRAVFEGDVFEVLQGTKEEILHRPTFDRDPEAKVTHAYAVVTYKDGTQVFEVLTRARIEEIRTKMSKAPDSPAWKNSYAQMAEKCALNRVERLVDTDPDTALRIAHAVDAEFTIEEGGTSPIDLGAKIADRVADQTDAAKRRLAEIQQNLQQGRMPEPEPPQETEEQRFERRKKLLAAVAEEALRQQLDADAAAQEADAALALAGFETWPKKDDEVPDLIRLSAEMLEAILEHFQKLGPGFGEPAQAAQEPAGAPEAPAPMPKVDPLLLKAVGGVIHLADPTVKTTASKPASCIGCGAKLGANQYATDAEPTTDPTRYCTKALSVVEKHWSAERVPDCVLEANLAAAGA